MARERVLRDKKQIIRLAYQIVDDEGVESLSVRRISKELGVSSMTIYNYVSDFGELKKEVLIEAFDIMYSMLYTGLNRKKQPVDIATFCRTFAEEVYNFSVEHRGLFIFMRGEGYVSFHSDAEVKHLYNALDSISRRSKEFREDKNSNTMGYKIFESTVFNMAYENQLGICRYTRDEFMEYVEFCISRFLFSEHCQQQLN